MYSSAAAVASAAAATCAAAAACAAASTDAAGLASASIGCLLRHFHLWRQQQR